VLQGKIGFLRLILRLGSVALLAGSVLSPAERGIVPVSVCDLLRDLPSYDGQTVAVVGRYSYRTNSRWIAQQSCQPAPDRPASLWVVENLNDAPKAPDVFQFDAAELDKKLLEVQQRTPLGKFRFGTPDYDRWAVVYGRVELRKGDDAKEFAANLVIRGNAMIIFLPRP
jgi:hypothetical protein